MNFWQRLTYFGGGFLVGLFILFFFLSGKKASCAYGPNARVLKNIRSKSLQYSPLASDQLLEFEIDTTRIKNLLENGEVDFGKSDTEKKPCKTYVIEDNTSTNQLTFYIENCDSIALVTEIFRDSLR